jgi:hypothetical protein
MTRLSARSASLLALALGIINLGSTSQQAHAQWGGYGGFFGGFNYVPSPTNLINQHSMIRAGRGMQGPTNNRPYGNSPNAYFNRVRDNGFVPSYDVGRRPVASSRPQQARSLGNTAKAQAQPAPVAAAAKTVLPLVSFFDASMRLIWPAESPVAGDLKEKRDVSDQACLVVLEETKRQPTASIATVADARQKLLDYGRPALQEIRTESTPQIAEMFHSFLLSLYDSLAQAALTSSQ